MKIQIIFFVSKQMYTKFDILGLFKESLIVHTILVEPTIL